MSSPISYDKTTVVAPVVAVNLKKERFLLGVGFVFN